MDSTGNGNGFPPVDPVGASLEEAIDAHGDVLARLDSHGEALVAIAGDMAAVRREQTTIRADVHRAVDAVTAHSLLLEAIDRKLHAIARHLGVPA